MSANEAFGLGSSESQEHWISVSDLMSGIMIMFLFIAISYMKDVTQERDQIKSVANAWNETQEELYKALQREFQNDLTKWFASLDRTSLSIRFHRPELMFDEGKWEMKPGFQEVLREFFPRYLQILGQPKFRPNVSEIRIEGHTSSEWSRVVTGERAYFYNMELSQNRTRAVLEFVLSLPVVQTRHQWAKRDLTANGLASSKLVRNDDGSENKILSRRVEFRVRTNAEAQIAKILEFRPKASPAISSGPIPPARGAAPGPSGL